MLEKFKYWDWKSIGITLLIFLLILGIIGSFFLPEIKREIDLAQLKGETIANITQITPKQTMTQGHLGNNFVIDHYLFYYNYEIDGVKYQKKELIKSSLIPNGYFKKIENTEYQALIKFDIYRPKKSKLILE